MTRTLILIFSTTLFSITLNAHTVKKMSNQDKKTIATYQAKCIKRVGLALDISQRMCNCQVEGNLKHMTIADLAVLNQDPNLPASEASKIENENPRLDTLAEVEYSVHIKCELEVLKKRVH